MVISNPKTKPTDPDHIHTDPKPNPCNVKLTLVPSDRWVTFSVYPMFICLQVLQELCRAVYGFTVKMSSKGDDDAVDEMCDDLEDEICRAPVSYTHLTLPTIYSV